MIERLRVSRLSVAQWERGRDLRLRALARDPDAFASTLDRERGFPPSAWQDRLRREDAATFVARRHGLDAGIAVGAAWAGRPGTAGLFGMWVAPDARGAGLGDALVAAVVEWSRDAGYDRLVLEVGDENAAAIALYERHGFRPTGRSHAMPSPREHFGEHERALSLR